MKTMKTWITREKEPDQSGNEYYLHWEQPIYKDHDNEGDFYWYSNGMEVALPEQESYGLNCGECKEWEMIESTEYIMMQKAIKELQRLRDDMRIQASRDSEQIRRLLAHSRGIEAQLIQYMQKDESLQST